MRVPFATNDLLESPTSGGGSYVRRVLWIDPAGRSVVLFDVQAPDALPEIHALDGVLAALCAGELTVAAEDRYRPPNAEPRNPRRTGLAGQKPKSFGTPRQIRDDRWILIESIVTALGATPDGPPAMYCRETRGALIADAIDAVRTRRRRTSGSGRGPRPALTKATSYKLLRAYWRHGQCINALLPNFERAGAPGVRRVRATTNDTEKRRGRRRKRDKQDNPNHTGRNLTTADVEALQRGAWHHQVTRGVTGSQAYVDTIRDSYADWQPNPNGGDPIAELPAAYPTEGEFRYHAEQARIADPERWLRTREGNRTYNSRHAEATGDGRAAAFGPGSEYQMDATRTDVWILNAIDRSRIIGAPVEYKTIDAATDMLVGLYLCLEGPSWEGARNLLYNTFSDKVAFCAAHGVDISREMWPADGMCETIKADRAEMLGDAAVEAGKGLRLRVKICPPYRGGFKSPIERHHRRENDDCLNWLPGHIPPIRERGDRDSRLDAVLTLDSLMKILIRGAVFHNCYRPTSLPLPEGYPTALPKPTPLELWNWGLLNRTGLPEKADPLELRLHLLPTVQATVRKDGVHVNGVRYTSSYLRGIGAFHRNTGRKSLSVTVAYEPRDLAVAWLKLEGGRAFDPLVLVDADRRYAGISKYDLEDYREIAAIREQRKAPERLRPRVQLSGDVDRDVAEAKKLRDAALALNGLKRPIIDDVRDARSEERGARRMREAWRNGHPAADGEVGRGVAVAEDDQYIAPPSRIGLLGATLDRLEAARDTSAPEGGV
jgi:hypothetical protein